MSEQDKKAPALPKTIIPWWQDGTTITDVIKEPYFLSKGVHTFFVKIRGWLLYPLQQSDALTCSESLLKLMAWDKDIERFNNEPLDLFRKRVKFAAINAKDSGSVAGFIRIFERLGVGFVQVNERLPERDWDIISIKLSDSQLSENFELLGTLIKHYGRTCRRYEYQVVNPVQWTVSVASLDWQQECSVAVLEE